MNKMKVVTVEYETKDHVVWKAGVLAYSIKDANDTIVKNVKNYDRPISTGMTREVDIISEDIRQDLIKLYTVKPDKVEDITKPDKEDVKDVEDVKGTTEPDIDAPLVCPFCSLQYKTQKTLLTHIKKKH